MRKEVGRKEQEGKRREERRRREEDGKEAFWLNLSLRKIVWAVKLCFC